MQIIIWAFCSMFVLLIGLAFLPLGFTFKGKLSISLASFVISLGGLAAINTFSLPLTGLLLIVLSFFTAYILDQRAGRLIYAANRLVEEEYEVEINSNHSFTDSKLESGQDNIPRNLTELEKVEPELQSVADQTKDDIVLTSLEYVEGLESEEEIQVPEDDISLLLAEDTEQQSNKQRVGITPEENLYSEIDEDFSIDELVVGASNSDEGYLSEIESLLNVGLEEVNSEEKNDFADDFSTEEVTDQLVESDDLEPLDDSTLEFLFSSKEVASGLDDEIKDMKNKELIKIKAITK